MAEVTPVVEWQFIPQRPGQLHDRMPRNQFDVVVVGRPSRGQSQFELEVGSVAQPVVGVQVLVAVFGERDTVNLANRCTHVASRQTAGSSARGRCRLTNDVTLADVTQTTFISLHCSANVKSANAYSFIS